MRGGRKERRARNKKRRGRARIRRRTAHARESFKQAEVKFEEKSYYGWQRCPFCRKKKPTHDAFIKGKAAGPTCAAADCFTAATESARKRATWSV